MAANKTVIKTVAEGTLRVAPSPRREKTEAPLSRRAPVSLAPSQPHGLGFQRTVFLRVHPSLICKVEAPQTAGVQGAPSHGAAALPTGASMRSGLGAPPLDHGVEGAGKGINICILSPR